MDDMVLWHNDREILLDAGYRLQEFVATELKLLLKPFCLTLQQVQHDWAVETVASLAPQEGCLQLTLLKVSGDSNFKGIHI
jgi:hypothetical protein